MAGESNAHRLSEELLGTPFLNMFDIPDIPQIDGFETVPSD